jgi:hypothetical protein
VPNSQSTQYVDQLHQQLNRYFDLEEVRTLCFVLNLDYDSIRGEGKSAKTRELILHLGRNGRLPELLDYARRERKHVQWPDPPAGFELPQAVEGGPAAGGPVYNVNTGGGVFVAGGVSTGGGDFTGRDRITHGDEIQGSKFELSGDFRGAVLNIQSRLDHVTQSVGAIPHGDPGDRAALSLLLDDLAAELAALPAESAADVESITRRVESLVKEMESEQPDPELLDIICVSLQRFADRLAPTHPAIPQLATHITALTRQLVNN